MLTPNEFHDSANKAYQSHNYREAADLFYQAAKEYLVQGAELSAAEMFNNYSVSLLQTGKCDTALEAVLGTAEIFEKYGDVYRQATACGNIGACYEAVGNYQKAQEYYQKSIDLFTSIGDESLKSHTLRSLSGLQLRQGDHLSALISMQSAMKSSKDMGIKRKLLLKLLSLPQKLMEH